MTSCVEVPMSCIDRIARLKSLQLYGMVAACGELQAEKPRQPSAPEAWLDRLGRNPVVASTD